ncbi:indole-3-glycerol phosphate synthase TrpC [Oceanobacillus piezotolerans]|uniref:Indole-3-glycerol phosphate synthase n=1 Tax=Oceanobacillus piezotolerans TaxID=2448030 RepID=A0A498DJD2_9BACI|nr:indole-3-glycerol phosphate synthase TrpC [Oceanobacillus piezotolerans]RLL42046.1 indole-3-glycerol phosphate synthase TrpC [Oceanobacillus piezotolerans]
MTILDKILVEKRKEVTELVKQTFDQIPEKLTVPSFKEQVDASSTVQIISEIKRASPSKGDINQGVDPITQAKQYEANGASAISVLTDKAFFNGTIDDLKAVREVVDIPILCKDFVIHPVQIDQAQAAGANIILLIVAALNDEDLRSLYNYAIERQLEVLVEVHNEEEMERALKLQPDIIGINNRNLKTFEVDIATTERLASMVTNPEILLISESGMRTQEDVIRVRDVGAEAVLVGETLMLSPNLEDTFKELKVALPVRGGNS